MDRIEGHYDATGLRFGVVASRFNDFITRPLLDGALDALRRHGASDGDVTVVWVPGAVEIPLAAQALVARDVDAVITLGAVIRGATSHYDYVCSMVASGVNRVALDASVPVIFGVLTVESIEQAIERAGTKAGNKGAEAAVGAIEMATLMRRMAGS